MLGRPFGARSGKAHNEHIASGFPATADIGRTSQKVRVVPGSDIRAGQALTAAQSCELQIKT
jgi:hypothetical protein